MTVPEVRELLKHLLAVRRWDDDEIVWWCNWRMERNRIARICHARRRKRELQQRDRRRKRLQSHVAL